MKATLRESSHGPLMRLDVRSDSLAERSGFELSVPLGKPVAFSGGRQTVVFSAFLSAVCQKPGCKCNKSDNHQKSGRIC